MSTIAASQVTAPEEQHQHDCSAALGPSVSSLSELVAALTCMLVELSDVGDTPGDRAQWAELAQLAVRAQVCGFVFGLCTGKHGHVEGSGGAALGAQEER